MGTLLPLSKAATSCALDVAEIVLLAFTVLVLVGLVGESRKPKRVYSFTDPRKKKSQHRICEAMVIVGVAGEFFADGGIYAFSKRLQAISNAEVADLNVEAGDARERAGRAEKSAAELLAQIQPRELTAKQQREIGDAMRHFTRRGVSLLSYPGDAEAYNLGIQIDSALEYARFLPGNNLAAAPAGDKPPMTGVRISGPPSETFFVQALASSLRNIGKLKGVMTVSAQARESVVIFVGAKPFERLK
jgi:hypothetical protein